MIPKFRAWHKELKMMFEVKSLVYTLRLARLTNRNDLVPSRTCSFDEIILMQLAHEDDCHIIYDKDIVMDANSGEIGVVFYSEEDCAWKVKTDSTEDWLYDWLYDSLYYWLGCEVLGSVYENPDLLESVEE